MKPRKSLIKEITKTLIFICKKAFHFHREKMMISFPKRKSFFKKETQYRSIIAFNQEAKEQLTIIINKLKSQREREFKALQKRREILWIWYGCGC